MLRATLSAGVACAFLASIGTSADAASAGPFGWGRETAPTPRVATGQPAPRPVGKTTPTKKRTAAKDKKKKDEPIKNPFGDLPKGPLQLVVSINQQRLTMYSGGTRVTQVPVSTGVATHPTPMGVFSVIEKDRWHRSNLYDNAPMFYMHRITWSGVALHEGYVPGRPASHGCIRLPREFAARLWAVSKLGVRVVIAANEVMPYEFSHPKLFVPKAKPAPEQISSAVDGLRPTLAAAELSATEVSAAQASAAAPGVTVPARSRPVVLAGAVTVASDAGSIPPVEPSTVETTEVGPSEVAAEAPAGSAESAADQPKDAAQSSSHADVESTSSTIISDAPAAADAAPASAEPAKPTLAEPPKEIGGAPAKPVVAEPAKPAAAEPAKEIGAAPVKPAVAEPAKEIGAAPKPASTEPVKPANAEPAKSEPTEAEPGKPVPPRTRTAEPSKRKGQVAVFISRKEKKLYVRQGFVPLFDMPVQIANPDQPLGTHVFTALDIIDNGTRVRWNAISVPDRASAPVPVAKKTGKTNSKQKVAAAKAADVKPGPTAAEALDRITIPQEAADRIGELLVAGSSLVISDQGLGRETGRYTEFIVETH